MNLPIPSFFVVATACGCLALSACAIGKAKPKTPPAAAPSGPIAVGSISLVNSPDGFVMIDSSIAVAPGTPLKALSPEGKETGTLKASMEQKPPFIIADITDGNPQPGDQVILPQPKPKPSQAATPAAEADR